MAESRNEKEPSYWRSLAQLHDGKTIDELKAHEFMAGVTEDFHPGELSAMSRKQFLALLTASAAFAASGCSGYRDKGEIVPYTRKPEEVTPGVANFYASTCTGCSQACGILIKTREGRPIKIDGNPDHPVNRGTVCARGQASILNLYDPNRLRGPQRGGGKGSFSWKIAEEEIRKALSEASAAGKQIAVVTGGVVSPTTRSVLTDFGRKYPTARFYELEAINDVPRRKGWETSYGSGNVRAIAWEKAKVIVALEADFLGTEGNTVEQIRRWAAGRDVLATNECSRLYAVEGSMSLTGANADYRLRLRPDAHEEFLFVLLHELSARGTIRPDSRLQRLASGHEAAGFSKKHGLAPEMIVHLADDLLKHRGEGIIVAGETLSEKIHVLVNYLNELLGNSALYAGESLPAGALSTESDWTSLVSGMKHGDVSVVIHAGANPVFQLPPVFGYGDALRAVPVSVSLTEQEDETAQACTHILPAHHAFESWGDYTVRTGIISLQQPVIAPLYDTRQREAVLLMLAGAPYSETLYHEYLMKRWETEIYPRFGAGTEFRAFWLSSLHDGVVTQDVPVTPLNFRMEALDVLTPPAALEGYVVAVRRNHFLGDGAFANNGWLQELPHPVSKVVWDNYAAVAPKCAQELGAENDGLIAVTLHGARVVLPVFVQPGQAEKTISVEMGYGRRNGGPIGTGIGVDVIPLLTGASLTGQRIFRGAGVEKAEGKYQLVTTQEHHALDDGPLAERLKDIHLKRRIIREGTIEEYRANPGFLHEEKVDHRSITVEVAYPGVKWAMAIDLNKCVGCNVCVSGCNVENNIPVVGKEQVGRGREMQWIRIDRYYAGAPDDPRLSHQPMLCQHCDQAPCENVCPVVATTHSPDGLNQMVYNRCVGTKYCSNNCPFKVRRFNFYNFRDQFADGYYLQEPVSLTHNPEVTVRSRGVMEKCTFCVQRIMEARQHATEQGKPLKGSDVRTACQEACPAQAIVFGDMNDPGSEIARYRTHDLGYHVLEESNVRPNVTYIARLRNIWEQAS
jgi:molybdopterin-containing oxidoreductase family iron-sulfur binding subunit